MQCPQRGGGCVGLVNLGCNMKVLVLGAEGFIGSHVAKLLENDTAITLMKSDIHTRYDDESYIQLPATRPDFDQIMKANYDVCINCTGAAHVGRSIINPKQDFFLNALNVMEILNSIRTQSPKCRFFNISSAAVYGQPKSLPIMESSEAQPISPYGYHKLMSEMLMTEYYEIYGISSISLRVFSCYGPGLKKQLFWDSYQKFKRNDLTFWGTGEESRDFIYVKDLAQMIYKLLNIDTKGHLLINAASGVETKIGDAVDILLKQFDPQCVARFEGGEDPGQPKNWVADISKIKDLVSMEFTPLITGLAEYADWLKELSNE